MNPSFLTSAGTMLDPPPPGTHVKAIRMLMVMLPMPDSLNPSNRAFKMAAITFCSWKATYARNTQGVMTRMVE
jgi:hypothetical protein